LSPNKIDVSPLISRVVSLDELPDVFEQLTSDRNRDQKVLVRPNG
jgi:threonine dehydrogenase-like Zn-dependent dehydrogenase